MRVLNYMLMCNWLSFGFKSKEEYNPKALHLGEKGGKMDPYPFFFRKDPFGNLRALGASS